MDERRRASLDPKLREVLTPRQKGRLAQVRLQLLVLQAWEDPEVPKALGLTEGQKQAIGRILAEAKASVPDKGDEIHEAARREAGGDPDKGLQIEGEKTAALYREYADRILGLLTEAQKEKWQELVGPARPLRYRVEAGFPRRRR